MTGTVLDELERLEREATAGEWTPATTHLGNPVVRCGSERVPLLPAGTTQQQQSANAALIALSRNHMSALVAVARAAQACIAHKDGAYRGPDNGLVLASKLAAALAPLERQP